MPLSQIQTITNQVVPNLGRRNILINGAFQHWQRGTSFSSNVYGSDRWKFYAPGSHAYSRSTDTPDFGLTAQPNGFQFSASLGGSGDATGLTQFVESNNSKHIPTSGTTKVILSFYLKHTTNSGTAKITSIVGTMDSADNSGASTNRSTQNHNTTTSWARYTHEMTGADLTAAVTNGLTVNIRHNGSGATAFLLTGCQLEISETVTPFEHRSVGEELALCQRYYEQGNFSLRQSGSIIRVGQSYHTRKRTPATVNVYYDGNKATAGTINVSNSNNSGWAEGGNTNFWNMEKNTGSNSDSVDYNGFWTAEAEI